MKRFQNILIAVDTRFEKLPALEWAVRLAEHNQAKLTIVEVLPEFSWIQRRVMSDAENMRKRLTDDCQSNLESLAEPPRERGVDVTTKVFVGKTSEQVTHEVIRSNHDLVVRVTKGAHSQATGMFGTTSMSLLRNCGCAVWLVRPDAPVRFDRVLAAIEPAPNDVAHEVMNKKVMELAVSTAEYEGGELHVVHSWSLFATNKIKSRLGPGEFELIERKAEAEVAAALDNFLLPYGISHVSSGVHLVRDEAKAATAIAGLAKQLDADLIVIGTVARSGVAGGTIGNTAEHVLDHAECSVLTIKPDGYISPVSLPDKG